ncbi:MAG: twin-arginine translocase TatA/TatE family subunit [Kiritimatiellia bacterium]|jgi:sec-independent protein translocase protein TatA
MRLGFWEIVVVFAVIFLLFGAKRLPDLARALGRSLTEFKKGREEGAAEDKPESKSEDTRPET